MPLTAGLPRKRLFSRSNCINLITQEYFGNIQEQAIHRYTIRNTNGYSVSVINRGAAIISIQTPDRFGTPAEICLGFDQIEGYLQPNNPYMGAIIGRYANRLARGRFRLNGIDYQVPCNLNGHALHGGSTGLDQACWTINAIDEATLECRHHSPHLDQGFPGNLQVNVRYQLGADNALSIVYEAVSDADTVINLTSHPYFNLSGGQQPTIHDHRLQILSDRITETDADLIPTGAFLSVSNTPFDFNEPAWLRPLLGALPSGYDNNYVLNKSVKENYKGIPLAAVVWEPASGRKMAVYTTEPGLQFYSAYWLEGNYIHQRTDQHYGSYGALCLEAQHFPDSPNHPSFPSTLLKKGAIYRQQTIYAFGAAAS